MATIHDHADEVCLSLGSRINAMRESRHWTLETLASRSGLSRAYLSRVEGGDRQPSIGALASIARALGVSIAALFEHPDEVADCVIVRAGSSASRIANELAYTPLSSSTKPFNLHPLAVTIPANRSSTNSFQHEGEEWLTVVGGRLRLTIDGRHHVLEVGDSAHFDSRLPHRLDALDDAEAKVLLVACPIPMPINNRGAGSESLGVELVS
jgi:transcriptional regulator with XRE-family HTH domain